MILTLNTDYSPATLKLLDFVVETEFVPFDVGSCIYIYIYIYNLDISSEIVQTNFNIIFFFNFHVVCFLAGLSDIQINLIKNAAHFCLKTQYNAV
jgi:hypothetical protein